MSEIDEKDAIILNLLQKDCRMPLTAISKHINLSVDATKKRINKLLKNKIFYPKIQLRPRKFGFKQIIDVKIKLHNYNEKDFKEFVTYLKANEKVTEMFSLSGEWDFSIVLIARDIEDLGFISEKIRNKFGKIINNWSESTTTFVHKFEEYDMLKIIKKQKKEGMKNEEHIF